MWSEPPLHHHNGMITGYSVSLLQHDTVVMYSTNTTSFTLTSLKPFSSYNFTVTARTSEGFGPYSNPLSFETLQDGKDITVHTAIPINLVHNS